MARGQDAPHSIVLTVASGTLAAAPGTDCIRWYPPPLTEEQAIVVRDVRVYGDNETGTGTATVNVMNQTTTMLSAAVSITADNTASAGTMADDGQEIVEAGRYVRIDATSTGTWTANTGFSNVYVQLNYDILGRHTGGGVRS